MPDEITPDVDPLEAAAAKDKPPKPAAKKAAPRKRAASKRKPKFDPGKFVGETVDTISAALILSGTPRLVLDGELLQAKRDEIASAVGTVAEANPAVMRTLERMATASTYGALVTVLASVALPIAANHGLLPPIALALSREPDFTTRAVALGPPAPKPKPARARGQNDPPAGKPDDPAGDGKSDPSAASAFQRLREQVSKPEPEPSTAAGSGLPPVG